jgi:hypothetical protein
MTKKTFLSLVFGIVGTIGLAGMALAGSQESCDRYYASSYWYPQNPSHRICAQDYYTYEGWGNYGLNCSDTLTYASYTSWRGFTQANGYSTSDSSWDYYIPWTETSPVSGSNYYYYDKADDIIVCNGSINHYTAYGYTNPSCDCVAEGVFGEATCMGVYIQNWNADNERLIASDCATPQGQSKRIYVDSARVSW